MQSCDATGFQTQTLNSDTAPAVSVIVLDLVTHSSLHNLNMKTHTARSAAQPRRQEWENIKAEPRHTTLCNVLTYMPPCRLLSSTLLCFALRFLPCRFSHVLVVVIVAACFRPAALLRRAPGVWATAVSKTQSSSPVSRSSACVSCSLGWYTPISHGRGFF